MAPWHFLSSTYGVSITSAYEVKIIGFNFHPIFLSFTCKNIYNNNNKIYIKKEKKKRKEKNVVPTG